MNNDIQIDSHDPASMTANRRNFLRSVGALGAASALPMLAGGTGLLLPTAASARISESIDDYKYKVGTWYNSSGVNCDVFRSFHVDNRYQADPAATKYKELIVNSGDSYYKAGTSVYVETVDSGSCICRTDWAPANNFLVYKGAWWKTGSTVHFAIAPTLIQSDLKCSTGKTTTAQTQGLVTLIPSNAVGSADYSSRVGSGAPLFGYVGYSTPGSSAPQIRLMMLRSTTTTALDSNQSYVYSNVLSAANASKAIDMVGAYSLAVINFETAFSTVNPIFKRQVSFLLGALSKNCTVGEMQNMLLCFAVNQISTGFPYYLDQNKVGCLMALAAASKFCRNEFENAGASWTVAGWTTADTWCQGLA